MALAKRGRYKYEYLRADMGNACEERRTRREEKGLIFDVYFFDASRRRKIILGGGDIQQTKEDCKDGQRHNRIKEKQNSQKERVRPFFGFFF